MNSTNSHAQHTPGPWTALIEGESQQGGETHAIAAGPHYMTIAEVAISAEAGTHGEEVKTTIIESEGRANARLIAAAPELLEAVSRLLHSDRDEDRDFARAAIAKAEGRT